MCAGVGNERSLLCVTRSLPLYVRTYVRLLSRCSGVDEYVKEFLVCVCVQELAVRGVFCVRQDRFRMYIFCARVKELAHGLRVSFVCVLKSPLPYVHLVYVC